MKTLRAPAKGQKNPITLILEEAAELVASAEEALWSEFGMIPLYVTAPGRGPSALRWPEDPEALTPEEMQALETLHGRDRVGQWLMEQAMRRMAESTMSPDGADEHALYD